MKVAVKVFDGTYTEQEITKTPFTLGRSLKCDVVIPHDAVSRIHCKIELIKGEFYVTDLNTRNGTTINEVKIEPNKPTIYHSFLIITLGGVAEIQVTL